MINTGYFTSRHHIIEWINDLLITSVNKIQQLGSAAIYCQLLDAAYPGKVPLNKVKWNAYLEVDFLYNFKILQTCFQRLGIHKFIEVQKLSKAKYQDNLQFAQWMKWFLQPKIQQNQTYNALIRRNYAEINLLFAQKKTFDLKQTHREQKENRQINRVMSSSTIFKPQANVQQMKMSYHQKENQKNMNKCQTTRNFKQFKEDNENSANPIKMMKKRKLEVTLMPSQPLREKLALNNAKTIESEDQQCF